MVRSESRRSTDDCGTGHRDCSDRGDRGDRGAQDGQGPAALPAGCGRAPDDNPSAKPRRVIALRHTLSRLGQSSGSAKLLTM